MNFGGKSKIKPVKGVVHTIRVQTATRPPPLPSVERARQQTIQRAQRPHENTPSKREPSSATASPAPPPEGQDDSSYLRALKRKPSRQLTPADQPLESDSSGEGSQHSDHEQEDGGNVGESTYKRQKTDQPIDRRRKLRSCKDTSNDDGGNFRMIHAVDVVPDGQNSKAARGDLSESLVVRVNYPSASQPERFDLTSGNKKDGINAINEILEIARIVRDVYLTDKQARVFTEPNSGVIRQLVRARNNIANGNKKTSMALLQNFEAAVDNYNSTVKALVANGTLADNLDKIHILPLKMIEFILQQIYDRAVSPHVDLLKNYETGSDEVYGELLSPFVSKVLIQTELKSDQVFVDLGSGVGNVVLQAALQFGSESWGCEIMPNACKLADKQVAEFGARCRLWGLAHGKVHLEKGDFLANDRIKAALRRADVVLVNNEVFSPQTNEALRYLFLDLKDGCHIISLQSFAVGNDRNENDPANLIQNTVYGEFEDKDVSWTNRRGRYFIATKDQNHLARIRATNKKDLNIGHSGTI